MRSSKSLGDKSQDNKRIFSISLTLRPPPALLPKTPLPVLSLVSSDPRLCEQTSEQNSKEKARSRSMIEPAVAERLPR